MGRHMIFGLWERLLLYVHILELAGKGVPKCAADRGMSTSYEYHDVTAYASLVT